MQTTCGAYHLRLDHYPKPYYTKKHTTSWVGYKAHLKGTCDEDAPHLITHVETTIGPSGDGDAVGPIHEALHPQDLLPGTHYVNTAYVDAERLVESKNRYGVELYGPARRDMKRQAREAKGFASDEFQIKWDQRQARCLSGRVSESWTPARDCSDNVVIKVKFSSANCRVCSSRIDYTHTQRPRRTVIIYSQAEHQALVAACQRQQEPGFAEHCAKRALIRGALSKGDERLGCGVPGTSGRPKPTCSTS